MLSTCDPPPPFGDSQKNDDAIPHVEIKHPEYRRFSAGKLQYRFQADGIVSEGSSERFRIEAPVFHVPAGAGVIRLTASRGTYSKNERTVLLQEDVELISASGDRLETSALLYDYATRQLVGKAPFAGSFQGVPVAGESFLFDLERGLFTAERFQWSRH